MTKPPDWCPTPIRSIPGTLLLSKMSKRTLGLSQPAIYWPPGALHRGERRHIRYCRFYLFDLVVERLADGPHSRRPTMLTAETYEIRNSVWSFSKVTPKQSAKPNLPITWQIIKYNLPLPYFPVTILYNVFSGHISLAGLEWICRQFLTFIVGFFSPT